MYANTRLLELSYGIEPSYNTAYALTAYRFLCLFKVQFAHTVNQLGAD